MNLEEYQISLLNMESNTFDDMYNSTEYKLDEWLRDMGLPEESDLVLEEVDNLVRFDIYYTTFEKQGEPYTYKRYYNKMDSYDYPTKNVSYNNGYKPLVPHVYFRGNSCRVPNEVLNTLGRIWE